MKFQQRLTGLAIGLGLSASVFLGTAPSAFAQPAQNQVFGEFKEFACIGKQVYIKLLLDDNRTDFFETTLQCESTAKVDRAQINRLFGGSGGRTTYVLNKDGQITGKALW
jgi:hypothetical protein